MIQSNDGLLDGNACYLWQYDKCTYLCCSEFDNMAFIASKLVAVVHRWSSNKAIESSLKLVIYGALVYNV